MISISHVSKRFGKVSALADVSLSIAAGERVAIVGTNGSGKTTLLRAIGGLLAFEGQISVNGIDVARQPALAMRSLSYMPQVAPPLEVPVKELVRAWCTLRERTVSQVSARLLALGIELSAVAGTRVRDLSGGMKQKLLAALALAAEAPLLICDEPTANLDAQARAAFFEAVSARPPTSALIICSHRVDEVRHLVDRVIEFSEGRVARDESMVTMMASIRGFRIEVAFHLEAQADIEAADLAARGFTRLSATRFVGTFTQAEKLSVVSGLVCALGNRLADLSVLDAESLHEGVRRVS